MRSTRILTTVAAAILLGSAPASSLNVPRAHAQTCSPIKASVLSLVGSQGAFGFVLIPSNACSK
jgi:hypothetical protein